MLLCKVIKTIKINVGSNPTSDLYEQKLAPDSQITKVQIDLKENKDEYIIYTNSVYVTEAFNKFGKQQGYEIIMYYDGTEMDKDKLFDKFSKPFEELIFD